MISMLQIKDIESEMAKTQKNKNTSFHLGTKYPLNACTLLNGLD